MGALPLSSKWVRARHGALGITAAAICAGLLGACGSPGSAQVSSSAVRGTCKEVSAVLSDGPDPGVDPVGYAEAQILPLRQLHSSDKSLQSALDDLASAYQNSFTTDGSRAAEQAVSQAAKKIDAICPGAAS